MDLSKFVVFKRNNEYKVGILAAGKPSEQMCRIIDNDGSDHYIQGSNVFPILHQKVDIVQYLEQAEQILNKEFNKINKKELVNCLSELSTSIEKGFNVSKSPFFLLNFQAPKIKKTTKKIDLETKVAYGGSSFSFKVPSDVEQSLWQSSNIGSSTVTINEGTISIDSFPGPDDEASLDSIL